MNRLKDFFEWPREEQEPATDYYLIETSWNFFVVSRETAVAVERVLDKVLLPRWVVFRDLPGSRHRVLAREVERVSEARATARGEGRQAAVGGRRLSSSRPPTITSRSA